MHKASVVSALLLVTGEKGWQMLKKGTHVG